jgi:F0F1-type ATP synthase assembly protein I
VAIPAFIFLFPPDTRGLLRAMRTLSSVFICYVLMNLAVHLQWDIRNAPFGQDPFNPNPANGWRMDCVNIGDGFSLVFALMMAWIPACVYVWFCTYFWLFYHHRFSKKITDDYKSDIVTRILSACVKVYLFITLLFIFAVIAHKAGFFNVKPIGWMSYLTIRPLLIPFEIFWY